jgi:hypothetical protein
MSTRLRYGLLFALAAVPLVDVREVKPGPLGVVLCLFGAHGLLSLIAFRRDRFAPRDVLTVLLWLGCFVVAGIFIVTLLALRLWPPVTPDGHRVMAIGQTLAGLGLGGGLGAAVAVFGSLRSVARDRRRERLVLHGIGALLLVALAVYVRGG